MEEPGRLQSMGSLRVGRDWATSLSRNGEGNGNPLQCSCLENPRDGGAWWAAIYGVAQSQTRLKRRSSSSICISEIIDISPGNLDSSLCLIQPSISLDVLCIEVKQTWGKYTTLLHSFPSLEPVCCSMSSPNCCFLTCIHISQDAGQMVWYSHLLKTFPQFAVIHTVKGFGIVSKAEVDVFLELSWFFNDTMDVGNLTLVPLPFLNPAWTSGISQFMYRWSLA